MPRYSISQLKSKDANLSIVDSDVVVASLGTNTNEISSYKVSYKQSMNYVQETYPGTHGFTIHSGVSASQGLSANCHGGFAIHIDNLPTTSSNLKTGEVFTQTAAQLGGSGSTKVLCIK